MSRVPDVPLRSIQPISTLGDFLAAGLELTSFCGAGCGQRTKLHLPQLIADRGPETIVDYGFRRSLMCPACGGPGGGLEIRKAEP